jgi:hypothetical protein
LDGYESSLFLTRKKESLIGIVFAGAETKQLFEATLCREEKQQAVGAGAAITMYL